MSENVYENQDWAEVSIAHTREKHFKGKMKCPFGQGRMAVVSDVSLYTNLGAVFYSHSSEKEILCHSGLLEKACLARLLFRLDLISAMLSTTTSCYRGYIDCRPCLLFQSCSQ